MLENVKVENFENNILIVINKLVTSSKMSTYGKQLGKITRSQYSLIKQDQ